MGDTLSKLTDKKMSNMPDPVVVPASSQVKSKKMKYVGESPKKVV